MSGRPQKSFRWWGVTRTDDFVDTTRAASSVELAAHATTWLDVGIGQRRARARVQCVSPGYLSLLGVRPYSGRLLDRGAEHRGQPAVLLGHGFWQRQFGGERSAIGLGLEIRGSIYTIVGVAPRGFSGVVSEPIDMWIPLDGNRESCGALGLSLPSAASASWLRMIGRIRTGYSMDNAEAELATLKPPQPGERALRLEAVGDAGQYWLRRDRKLLPWLIGGGLVAYLVAFSNATALSALGALRRRREMAIRLCLGASRLHIARLLLSEALAVAFVSAGLGWLAARGTAMALGGFWPAGGAGEGAEPRLWLLLAALALLAVLPGGILALVRDGQSGPAGTLRIHPQGDRHSSRVRHLVLAGQLAISFALLVTAGLFWRSVSNLTAVVGYDLGSLVSVSIDPNRSVVSRDVDLRSLRDDVLRQLRTRHSSTRVSLVSCSPLSTAPRQYAHHGPTCSWIDA